MIQPLDWVKWKIWRLFPQWMPANIQHKIWALSPYVCNQIGQGGPMVVMRREIWEAGGYEEFPGAPINLDGAYWIIRQWLQDNPNWKV